MYLVVIAWIYVALMMSVAEATNTTGTLLGGVITFLLYGAAPVTLVVYLMGSPGRRRQVKAREAAEREKAMAEHAELAAGTTASSAPDAGGHAPGDGLPPIRKEP